MNETNKIELIGKTWNEMNLSHQINGEKFYELKIDVNRSSGQTDTLNLLLSDKIIFVCNNLLNKNVWVKGSIRTYNDKSNGKNHVKVFMFVDELDVINEEVQHENEVELEGYIVKKHDLRETPLSNRMIVDIIIAINMNYGRSEYIPVVTWNKTARYVNGLNVGDKVKLAGRFQSRDYSKNNETKTAYEVSAQELSRVE